MKRSTDTRRSPAEVRANLQSHYGELAEKPANKKASENFHSPAYRARKLIRTHGKQMWHGDVTEYIARKYKIGGDADGNRRKKKRE